jgi:hypothetical protein
MSYLSALHKFNELKKELTSLLNRGESVLGLKIINGTFRGNDSIVFNKQRKALEKAIKEASIEVHQLRPYHLKLSEFQAKIRELQELVAYPRWKSGAINDLKKLILEKYAYCVDITSGAKTKCVHIDCGIIVDCNCRPGKKDPSKKVLSEELVSKDSGLRKILVVRVDKKIIHITPSMSAEEIRRNVREGKQGCLSEYVKPLPSRSKPTDEELVMKNAIFEAQKYITQECDGDGDDEIAETLIGSFYPLQMAFAMTMVTSPNVNPAIRAFSQVGLVKVMGDLNKSIEEKKEMAYASDSDAY